MRKELGLVRDPYRAVSLSTKFEVRASLAPKFKGLKTRSRDLDHSASGGNLWLAAIVHNFISPVSKVNKKPSRNWQLGSRAKLTIFTLRTLRVWRRCEGRGLWERGDVGERGFALHMPYMHQTLPFSVIFEWKLVFWYILAHFIKSTMYGNCSPETAVVSNGSLWTTIPVSTAWSIQPFW